MSYYGDKNNTPAQQAAYAKRAEEIKAANDRVEAVKKEVQAEIDTALNKLQAACEVEGISTYINPTGEYGGGMYYTPKRTEHYAQFDAEGNAIAHPDDEEVWENSDAGWQSSSTSC